MKYSYGKTDLVDCVVELPSHGVRSAKKPLKINGLAGAKSRDSIRDSMCFRVVNSAVECHLHTVEASGSIPLRPTMTKGQSILAFFV